MQLDLIYSERASDDLEAIVDYIGQDDTKAARSFVDNIMRRCQLLLDFPQMGVERPDIAKNVRLLVHQRAVIIYRLQDNEVLIVRVLYGGRDYSVLNEP